MTNNERKEICKAFAYNTGIDKVSDVTGLSEEDLTVFVKENQNGINKAYKYYTEEMGE